MDMIKDFHMNGGIGDASYATNSMLQKTGIMMTKAIIEQATNDLCCNNTKFPETLAVADLGCSSGPNTFMVASTLIDAIAKISHEMGCKLPEIQIHLNDLPTNDFNTTFSLLHEFQTNLTSNKFTNAQTYPSCYFTGVPGSFYSRLFPAKSLHFVHSSYSLHWLSKILEVGKINKGSIYLSSTTPKSVSMAYYEQFQKDFIAFLRNRSEEVVAGGRMILTLYGRRKDDPCCEQGYYLWRLFSMALEEMVFEGLIEEEKLDSFNLPIYMASPTEIKSLVTKEGSFAISRLQISDNNWMVFKTNKSDNNASQFEEMKECHGTEHDMAMGIRVGTESIVGNHFGREILNDVYMRYEKILTNRIPNEENEVITSITISLIRKI